MTQHSVNKGLKKFGEEGTRAMMKELVQLHKGGVAGPKHTNELTKGEQNAAVHSLMFLKRKRNGTIKGRACANGHKHREYTKKEEASSPTVAIELVMISCTIDAKERRNVVTLDIPGAFMQDDMDNTVHMKLEGKRAELMVQMDPTLYCKYIEIEKGKKVLHCTLKIA
jgi:hypothetical protein